MSSTRKHGEYSLLLLKTSGLQQLKSVITDDQDGGTVQLVTEIDVKEVFSSKLSIKFFVSYCQLSVQVWGYKFKDKALPENRSVLHDQQYTAAKWFERELQI